MIRPRYAFKLARTKLRSKRGMLLVSTVIASLLFAALIACIIVFTTAEKSADNFIKQAGNNKYLVQVRPYIPDKVLGYTRDYSPEDIQAIKAFEVEYYNDLREKYKAAGVPYEKSVETPAVIPDIFKPETLPEEQRVTIDRQSPVAEAWFAKKLQEYARTAPNTLRHLKEVGFAYGASGYYAQSQTPVPSIPSSRLILDGKEDFSVNEMKRDGATPYDTLINSAFNSHYQFQDDALLSRYLLAKDPSKLEGVPVIITSQEAASLFGKELGIGTEPKDDSAKREWIRSIQKTVTGRTYQVCSRNSAEQALLTKIQRDYAEIQSKKDDSNYKAPSLQYQHPSTPCGDITVKQDTRTLAEKQLQNKADEQQRKLGTYIAPEHHITTFQVVGIIHALPYSNHNTSIEAYIKNLLSPQDPSQSAIIPARLYEKLPDNLKIDGRIASSLTPAQQEQAEIFATRVLEFPSIDQARSFLKNEACSGVALTCPKPFFADPYGSNYLLIDEIGKLFQKIINIALPILLGLALIIMWLTISRIMTENRKETAAYRAMGAKRSDIATIYLTYILLIALRIAALSLIIGVGIAYLIDQLYGSRLNDIALTSFGIISDDMRFSLFSISSPLIWIVVGIIFLVSLTASIHPLLRNVMRPPIQDMREE